MSLLAVRQRKSAHAYGSMRPARAPYVSPRLEVLGSLRSVTHGTGAMGKDAGGTKTRMSDSWAKSEIVEIGRHPMAFGIYRVRHTGGHAELCGTCRQVGVMAKEVAEKWPDAASCRLDALFMVDYGRLLH